MDIQILKIKLKNHIKSKQKYFTILTRLALQAAPFCKGNYKLAIYDYFLQFNPRSPLARLVLKKTVETSSKVYLKNKPKPSNVLVHSIILKRFVSDNEKGVILISFESELLKLASNNFFSEIEKQYTIIFIPSWQPFFSNQFYYFLSKIKEPFWIMPSSTKDLDLCATVGPLCQPLPFQCSSWADANSFPTIPQYKDIDIIMLANFMEYKRHWLLFEAIADLPDNLRIVLMGRAIGKRTQNVLIEEARLFHVENRFELIENPSNEAIRELLGRSRLFCALSAKEGSYVAIAESLLSGTPVGIYEDAIVGSKDYINNENGIFFNNKDKLSNQIGKFLDSFEVAMNSENIQKWAKDNISAQVNNSKLNSIIRDSDLARGKNWTEDLAPFYCQNFEFHYFNNPVHQDEYLRLEKEWSLTIYSDAPK